MSNPSASSIRTGDFDRADGFLKKFSHFQLLRPFNFCGQIVQRWGFEKLRRSFFGNMVPGHTSTELIEVVKYIEI